MDDLREINKMNESLPNKLQSPDFRDYDSENADDQPTIVNMQKSMYTTIIGDLERRIGRLTKRNNILEKFCKSAEAASQNIEAEKKIVELNNLIANETRKIDELKNKCTEIENEGEKGLAILSEKTKCMEDAFRNTKIKLYSEIRRINAKLNSIEDFKASGESLRAKWIEQNELILKKEEDMQRTLKNIEHKSKAHRENLRREAFNKTLEVSDNFQCDLKKVVPLAAQRLMQENVILENELQLFWIDHANTEEKKIDCKLQIEKHKTSMKEARANTKQLLITSKLQNLLLKKLQSVHLAVTKALSKSFKPSEENFQEKYLKLMEETKNSDFAKADFCKRKLEVLLHQEKIKCRLVNTFKSQVENKLKKYCNTLSTLKGVVNSAAKINDIGAEKEFANMDLEKLADYLLRIMEGSDRQGHEYDVDSIDTVSDASITFKVGDLGFDPEHIEIEADEKLQKLSSSSVISTSAILKEIEKLQEQFIDEHRKSSSSSSDITASSKLDEIKESKVGEKELIDHKQKERETASVLESIESLFEYEMEDSIEYFTDY